MNEYQAFGITPWHRSPGACGRNGAKALVSRQPMSNRLGEPAGKAGRPLCIFNRLRPSLLILNFGRSNAYYLFIAIFERRKPTPLEQRELKESNTHEISTGYGPRTE